MAVSNVNYNNPASYKSCRKKQYEMWACIPPAGTIVVNKMEQVQLFNQLGKKDAFSIETLETLRQRNPQTYAQLLQLANSGMCYLVKPGDVVLSGTRGELWVAKAEKVQKTYQVFHNGAWTSNWAGMSAQRGIKADNSFLLPWVKILARGDAAPSTMACFVPLKQKGVISTSWGAKLSFNAPGVDHGLGDFIVCSKLVGDKPNLNDRWVVNGAVFADTYNNQGWGECLKVSGLLDSPPEPVPLFNYDVAKEPEFSKDLYNFVGRLAQKCASEQHKELAFRVKPGDKKNEIYIEAKTVLDFAKKNSTADFKAVGVRTVVSVNPDNTVTFVNKLVSDGGALSEHSVFKFTVPTTGANVAPQQTAEFLQNNAEIVFGLCGFVREVGVRSSFQYMAPLTKADYDGIRDYTMTSGATNRLLRGLSGSGEQSGEGKAQAVRCVANCDSLFDKVVTCRPLRVFRGEPYEQRVADNGANFNELAGFRSVNTAYSSTTLNVQSTPMFARHDTPVNGIKGGIIWAIDIPAGTRAHFSHTVAGWKQQFEILLDRRYDIVAGDTVLSFADAGGCVYKVVRGTVVEHQPCGPLDHVQSQMLIRTGKMMYNELGRVSFEKEYSSGVLHEAFNKIRERGYSDIQWQDAYDSRNEVIYSSVNSRTTSELIGKDVIVSSAIILRVNNPDLAKKNQFEDLAFVLSEGGQALEIHKVRVSGVARQDHSDAEGLRWSQYGLSYMRADVVRDENWNVQALNGVTDANDFNQEAYDMVDGRQVLYLKEGTSDEIASRIIRYAKTHKNICLLPLLDVARYFDQVFTQVIDQEGYELMRSIRVERHYDRNSQAQANDPQAGFVPCKYQITGDNDDHLVIDVKFERDKATGKLRISYRGQSQGTKVNESKSIQTDIFNNTKMHTLASGIIYTFAKRMHLSKSRKFDKLISYFCHQTGCTMVRCPQKKEDVLKSYKVWGLDRKSYFTVDITKLDVERFSGCIEFDDGRIQFCEFDFSDTIYRLYHQLCNLIMGGDANNVGA